MVVAGDCLKKGIKDMPWKKANQDLITLLENHLAWYECDRRFMMGSPTFFVNNNMFAGVHEDTIILRLSGPDREAIYAASPDIRPFTPFEGRPMKEYAAVPYDVCEDEDAFRDLLERSYRYAASLPPGKQRKGKR